MKLIKVRLNDEEYENLKLLSIFMGLSMGKIVRLSLFKRVLSAYQRRRIKKRVNGDHIHTMMAFTRPSAYQHIMELLDYAKTTKDD